MCKISVITINFNGGSQLENTLQSVASQTYRDFEFIVIDGGSSDQSLELLDKYSKKITFWVSEPDSGIYNAQNKGLIKAKGEYVLFLNSGDSLFSARIFEDVVEFLDGTDIVYGDLMIRGKGKEWIKKYNENVTFSYFLKDTLPHQGSFLKRALFNAIGFYNENLIVSSDWEFFLKAISLKSTTLTYLNFVVANYDYTGISSKPENEEMIEREKRSVLEKEYPRFLPDYDELLDLRRRYPLLANSRAVKFYFKVRRLFKQ